MYNVDADTISISYYLNRWFFLGFGFYASLSISFFSAALGLAKCLKNGVARILVSEGLLNGIISGRYILAFLACIMCLLARGACLGFASLLPRPTEGIGITIMILLLPQLFLAIQLILNVRESKSLEMLFSHPSLFILPTVTFFTFSKIEVSCKGDDSSIRFRRRFTWMNIGVSFVGYISWLAWYYYRFVLCDFCDERDGQFFFIIILPTVLTPFLLSASLTVLFLHLDKLSPCCCDCFLLPGEEISVYNPKLNKRSIIINGKVVETGEEEEITKEAVEIEMVVPNDNEMNLNREEAETSPVLDISPTCPRSNSLKEEIAQDSSTCPLSTLDE